MNARKVGFFTGLASVGGTPDGVDPPTSARALIHRLFESGRTSYRLDEYLDAHRAEVLAEADLLPKADVVTWLVKKAREETPVEVLASKVARGAIRPDNLQMLPARFFEPGRTYTRQVHGDRAAFRVEAIATHPDGYPVAFGWYRREPKTSWHAYSSDDFHDGWTEVGEGV